MSEFCDIEIDIGDALANELETRLGYRPDEVVLTPVHAWFPFSMTSRLRVQFKVTTATDVPAEEGEDMIG